MDQQRLQELTAAYLLETITSDEGMELSGLLKEPDYEAAFREILLVQLHNGSLDIDQPSEAVYERLEQKLRAAIAADKNMLPPVEKGVLATGRVPILRMAFVRVAAAIILLIGGGYLWWHFEQIPSLPVADGKTPVMADVQAGHPGAILTLGDGRTITLDSMQSGVIADERGTQVSLSNGQLTYDASDARAISYNTMSTPRGRQFQLVLPDGSKVWLNALSSVTYPTSFVGGSRRIKVLGEAYVEVAKKNGMPFIVDMERKGRVEVLGTHFDINAYADEPMVKTTLLEGSVRVVNGVEKMVLAPGQQAQAWPGDRMAVVNDVDLDKVIAWKNGLFNFDGANLVEVMMQLQRWYDFHVVYEKQPPPIKFFGKMDKSTSLAGVLKGLQGAGLHFRIEPGGTLIVGP
ncbi:FecR family protein [Flavitalea flava]